MLPFDPQLLAEAENPEEVSPSLWKVTLWVQLTVGFPPNTNTPGGAFPAQDNEQGWASPAGFLLSPTPILSVSGPDSPVKNVLWIFGEFSFEGSPTS